MSQTFTLTGNSSYISSAFFPPIELDPQYEYSIALVSLSTWNSIPNIEAGKNKLYFVDHRGTELDIVIPTGTYEIQDIESYIQKQLGRPRDTQGELNEVFSLKPNNNTLKCELKSRYDVNFKPSDTIAGLLGFSNKLLKAFDWHQSDLPVQIVQVVTIRVECNLISGSYYNNAPSHTLYEFMPTVDPGYSINIEPRNLIYLPVTRKTIDNITIQLLDQNSKSVNLNGEEIVIRLELKRNGFGV